MGPPFFASLQLFFPNPPEIGLTFGSAAVVVEKISGLRNMIRSAINSSIAEICVLPQRIAVDMNEFDTHDIIDLTYPDPVGVLRFTLLSGTEIESLSKSFFHHRSSKANPCVMATFGIKTWVSPIVRKSSNPQWGGLGADFVVHDHDQVLSLRVFDSDSSQDQDLLGYANPVDVHELTEKGPESTLTLELLKPDSSGTNGMVTFSTHFLRPATEWNEGGSDMALLSVKLITVRGLDLTAQYPFKLGVQVLDAATQAAHGVVVETTSKASRTLSLSWLTEPLKRSCLQLSQLGHTPQVIADVLGVDVSQVEDCMTEDTLKPPSSTITKEDKRANKDTKETQKARLGVKYPLFEEILHLLIPICKSTHRVKLTLLDKKGKSLGETSVSMQSVFECQNLKLYGPFYLNPNVEVVGSIRLRWLC